MFSLPFSLPISFSHSLFIINMAIRDAYACTWRSPTSYATPRSLPIRCDSHNLRHHPRQSTASPGSKWGKSAHNASRDGVHGFPPLWSLHRDGEQTRTPQDVARRQRESRRKKTRNYRKGSLITAITSHYIDVSHIYRYQFPLYSS